MNKEDLSFTLTNEDGQEMINDIISIVPNSNNKEEPYIMFTDYSLDNNDEFIVKYGKLKSKNDEFYIQTELLSDEIEYIKKMQEDEIIKHVNDAIGETFHG